MARVFKSIAFIDPYAGAGKYKDSNKEYDGSPLIMSKFIQHILEIENSKCTKAKYFANDIDKDRASSLKALLDDKFSHVSQYDAKYFISKCLEHICTQYSSALFFIDPFNYGFLKEDIDNIFDTCAGYFKSCQCEIILFLPVSNVYRFKKEKKCPSVSAFIDSYNIKVEEDTSPKKFMERVRLAIQGKDKFCASVELPAGTNTYALFFIGKHIYGADKFLEARDKCISQDPQQYLFIDPESAEGKLAEMLKSKAMKNWEIYEWGLSNNFSKKQIKSGLETLVKMYGLKRDFINCRSNARTYLLDYDNYNDKSKEVIFYFGD